jgi:hypothetical protein
MEYVPDALLNTYLLPAAQAGGALPDNPEQTRRLAELVQALETYQNPSPFLDGGKSPAGVNIPPTRSTSARRNGLQPTRPAEVAFEGSRPKQNIGLDDVCRQIALTARSPTITYYEGTWVSEDISSCATKMRQRGRLSFKMVWAHVFRGRGVCAVKP